VGEVIREDLDRVTPRLPLTTAIRVLAYRFLLLRVDRDDRDSPRQALDRSTVDVHELRVSIGVTATLFDSRCSLQRVASCRQQLAHLVRPHRVTPASQLGSQNPDALQGPPQRRLGTAPCRRLDERLQGRNEVGIFLLERLPTCSPTPIYDDVHRHACTNL